MNIFKWFRYAQGRPVINRWDSIISCGVIGTLFLIMAVVLDTMHDPNLTAKQSYLNKPLQYSDLTNQQELDENHDLKKTGRRYTQKLDLFRDREEIPVGTYWIKIEYSDFTQAIKKYITSFSFSQLHVPGEANITKMGGCEAFNKQINDIKTYPCGFQPAFYRVDDLEIENAAGEEIEVFNGKEDISLSRNYHRKFVTRTEEELDAAEVQLDVMGTGEQIVIDSGPFINWMNPNVGHTKQFYYGKFRVDSSNAKSPLVIKIKESQFIPNLKTVQVINLDGGIRYRFSVALYYVTAGLFYITMIYLLYQKERCIDILIK